MIANFVSKFYENWIILYSNSAVAIADLEQEELKKCYNYDDSA